MSPPQGVGGGGGGAGAVGSRFIVQRLNSSDVGMPRRRASVSQAQSQVSQSPSEFHAAHFAMSNEVRPQNETHNGSPKVAHSSSAIVPGSLGRGSSLRDNSSGIYLKVDSLREGSGGSLRAYLRDSLRLPRSLQHHLSREALPKIDNYNGQLPFGSRPTLEELHLGESAGENKIHSDAKDSSEGFKFGWIQGVFIRCLLNIWGVMLFLRLSWIVANAGIGQAILVVLLASAVTSLTALSMSAVSTNGQIKGGGTYYMISRSLGPEFGAAIGIIFAIANAVAVSLHTVGFCEALNDLLKSMGVSIIDGAENDIRITGSITLVVLALIVSIGMEWEAKAQLLLMAILVVSLVNFIVGSIVGPTSDDEIGKGFVGYNLEVITDNLFSDYRVFDGFQQNFFSVFAIFFPAATGILAGANISGDLKDPSAAIPKGTLLAIVTTSFSYVAFATIAGASVLRDATGNFTDYINGTLDDWKEACVNRTCEYGLHNSYQVMELVSWFGPLNYAGCFAATLSSALACFVSAPKVFQALCKDRLFPYLHVFAKGYGKNKEPLRGYALTFIIAVACVLIARLNVIAPLISNCYLASYALVNFSTFHVDLIQPVGWRPTFKYYNKWLSLLGCVLSVAAMFLCSWPTALITFALVAALFMVVKYRKPDVNWGSSAQAQAYKTALITVQQLNTTEEHVKTYTPQLLVMTGSPNMRPSLVDFAYLICKKNSLLICAQINEGHQGYRQRSAQIHKCNRWMRMQKVKGFYNLLDNTTFDRGVTALLQSSGIGKMKPNIVLLGYKSDWRLCSRDKTEQFFAAIHNALEMHVAVSVLRVQEGLDYTGVIADFNWTNPNGTSNAAPISSSTNDEDGNEKIGSSQMTFSSTGSLFTELSGATLDAAESGSVNTTSTTATNNNNGKKGKEKKKPRVLYRDPQGNELSKDIVQKICQFRLKQKKGTIDVWWLYDDGGLTMLLPQILTTRSTWANSKLRVFCLADAKDELHKEKTNMRQLLAKFRIPVSDVVVIPDVTALPSSETRSWFDTLTRDLIRRDTDSTDTSVPIIKESELLALKEKTFRHLRLRELLLQHSSDANLVVMTLPMPRKGTVSAVLYLAWLETLTANMPPFLLVRGNQTSVLTFYS